MKHHHFMGLEKKNNQKDTWTEPRGRVEAVEGGGFGWGGGSGGKVQTTVIEQQ